MNPAPTPVAFRTANPAGGRTAAGIEIRDEVLAVPPDLIDALTLDGEAGWRFADLSYRDQRRFVLGIEAARTRETRRRRIARTVETLRAELI